jgi:hypothetical protein
MDLLTNGQQPFMLPSYSPNGGFISGKPVENNASYLSHTIVVEDNAAKMHSLGRAVILNKASVTPADLKSLHVHTTFPVPKQGGLARVVTHCSKGSSSTPSYNESVDIKAHAEHYPRPTPPRLKDFADMLFRLKTANPDSSYFHAAIVDAKSAFQLYHLSYEKFKLMWTTLQVQHGREWVHLLLGNACGTFGDLGAGDTWDVPASVWTELENLASALWEALTYVDDMAIVAAPVLSDLPPRDRQYYPEPRHTLVEPSTPLPLYPAPNIHAHYAIYDAVREARDNLARMFGMESSADTKAKIFFGFLEAVGWHFDLRVDYWTVVPLPKKIDKIAHYLFNVVTPSVTVVPTQHMRTLAGLLCWYSVALPLGRAFVYPLFQCRETLSSGMVRVHPAAQRDLSMWRALIRVAMTNPSILGCPIDLLRSDRTPDFYTVTDASTRTGGGAWLATTPQWIPGAPHAWLTLRWTQRERDLIAERLLPLIKPTIDNDIWNTVYHAYDHYRIQGDHRSQEPPSALTINILEFATVVFLIMVHAPDLRGRVISIGSDNTATLCWLVRNRASCGAADNLLKFLALTCTIYHIRLVVHHVRGIHNQLSDWISRVTNLDNADPHDLFDRVDPATTSSLLRSLQHQLTLPLSDRPDRRAVCRILLSLALTTSTPFSMNNLLRLMLLLRDLPTVPPSLDDRIPMVLDAYQSLPPDMRPTSIPQDMETALALAEEWTTLS